jgi:hypothetical protein
MLMTNKKRDRIADAIREYMERDGDHCSLCRAPFPHMGRTFGGLTAAGVVALVGECCRLKLRVHVTGGIYILVNTPEWWATKTDRVLH